MQHGWPRETTSSSDLTCQSAQHDYRRIRPITACVNLHVSEESLEVIPRLEFMLGILLSCSSKWFLFKCHCLTDLTEWGVLKYNTQTSLASTKKCGWNLCLASQKTWGAFCLQVIHHIDFENFWNTEDVLLLSDNKGQVLERENVSTSVAKSLFTPKMIITIKF